MVSSSAVHLFNYRVTKLKNKQVLSFNKNQERNKHRANKRTKKQETVRDIMQYIGRIIQRIKA